MTGRQMIMILLKVADDDIAARVYDYVAEKVSREQFLKEFTFKPLSHQINNIYPTCQRSHTVLPEIVAGNIPNVKSRIEIISGFKFLPTSKD